ncbi:hypothetical protein [Paenarthrobacter ureafaciens]|uniref:hypothetical protein n=1 Tax=Paenarthrobacter ureafaciens TaxID=37931 RepID=UPI001C2B8E0E|nr:hypothetical protein [Paenarthrobacter ureafaciens]
MHGRDDAEDPDETSPSKPSPEENDRPKGRSANLDQPANPHPINFGNGIEIPPGAALQQALLKMVKPLLYAQEATRAAALKPLYDTQENWTRQLGIINSDIFKTRGLEQPNLNSLAAQLTRNIDFGLSNSFAEQARQFAATQFSWLQDLGPTFERLKASFYPPNLRGIKELRLEEVEQVVMVDGIALYSVPRPSIAEALVRADGAAKRREILGRRLGDISADCRAALNGCKSDIVAPYVRNALAALNALDDGHTEAAQALAGSVLDAVVNSYFGKERYNYTPDKKGNRTNAAYDEFGAHEYIAFAPIWQAYQKFFPDEGLPVPYTFSRNATAHTASSKQFTRRNAIQCLMIITGILMFIDEQIPETED